MVVRRACPPRSDGGLGRGGQEEIVNNAECEAGPPQRSGKWLLSADAFERRPLPIPIVRNFIAVSRIVALRIVGRSKAETDLSGKLYEGFDAAAFHVRETRRQSTIITRRDANRGPEILTYGGSLGFRPKR